MATIILQVLIEVDDVHDSIGDDLKEAVRSLIVDSGELSGAFFAEHGVKDVTVVFEDVV